MNLLVSLIADTYDDSWLSELLGNFNIGNCIVLVRDEKTAQNSIVVQKYATHVFFHAKLKKGDYSDVIDIMDEAPPVDLSLLDNLAEYESQVFWMMERCVSAEYNQRWQDYIQHLRFWNWILDKLKIEVFIAKGAPHEVYDYAAYLLAKKKNIKYVAGYPMAYYNRLLIVNDVYNHIPDFEQDFRLECKHYKNASCNEITLSPDMEEMYGFYVGEKDRTPYYMKNVAGAFRNKKVEWLYTHFSFARFVRSFKNLDGLNNSARKLWYIIRRIRLAANAVKDIGSFSIDTYKRFEDYMYNSKMYHEDEIAINYYKCNTKKIDYRKNYIYVALHMQPENTSSPLGGKFVDQALMIEMISYHLPKDWIIYVKEHPAQIKQSFVVDTSYRSLAFYERINRLKNVSFVSLEENTFNIIEKARAVATLTGTVGIEAISKGIPCLLFGYSYLQYAPNVYVIRNNDDCVRALRCLQMYNAIDDDYYKKIRIYFKVLERHVYKCTTEYYTLKPEEMEKNGKELVKTYYKEIRQLMDNS